MSAGRYHPKACQLILNVIKSAEANAKNKGYNATDLKVVHIAMQIGPKNNHQGRSRGIFKNSHIEVVLKEVKGLVSKKGEKKSEKTESKSEKKTEKTSKKNVKKDN